MSYLEFRSWWRPARAAGKATTDYAICSSNQLVGATTSLLGLRRHRDWTAIRSHPLKTAMNGLLRTYRFVIADTDADMEGESETGSKDVEDRNRLARTAITHGDPVIVVGAGDTLSLHSLVRTLVGLADSGIGVGRLLPVVNCAERRPRYRGQHSRSPGSPSGEHGSSGCPRTSVRTAAPWRGIGAARRYGPARGTGPRAGHGGVEPPEVK